jgi:hypothetical protein
MKYTRTLSLFFVIAITISACASQTSPTMSAGDVQNTAQAAAVTAVAQTQVAIPTSTSVPATEAPTQTPLPTDTPVAEATETPVRIPSLEPTLTATSIASTSGNADPCNKPLQSISGGKPAKIKIENNSGAPITFALYLNLTPFGDCGYRGYTLGTGGSTLITDLIQGCYSVSAYINDPKKPTKSFGYGCINNPDKWTFIISRKSVVLQGR